MENSSLEESYTGSESIEAIAPPPLPEDNNIDNIDVDDSEAHIKLQMQLDADKEKLSALLSHVYDIAKIEDDSWVLEDTQVTDLTWNDIKEGRVKPSVNIGRRWNRIRTSYVSSVTESLITVFILLLFEILFYY